MEAKLPKTKPKADAVVVLGAAVWAGGEASPSLRRRAVHGARLLRADEALSLMASGGVGRYPPSEASVIRDIALDEGVLPEKIILDERSTSTLESAINCVQIFRKKGWSRAIIVTDHYHSFRARFLFRRLGVSASSSAPDRQGAGTSRLRWYYLHVREFMAIPWSWVRILGYRWKSRDTQ